MYQATEEELEQAKIEAMAYLQELPTDIQKAGVIAIQDVLDQGKDGLGINTALHKKTRADWCKWRFGLWFMPNFDNSVLQQINREKSRQIDLAEFFKGYESKIDERIQEQEEELEPGELEHRAELEKKLTYFNNLIGLGNDYRKQS